MKKKHPFGITVIIILQTVSALLTLTLLASDQEFLARLQQFDLSVVSVEKLILFGTITLQIIIAIGLWGLQRWAWFLTMILVGWSMTLDIWQFIKGEPEYLAMLLNVIMVFYLNQREVQRAFSRQRAEAQRL